jgi:type VI secretion system protein ImpE
VNARALFDAGRLDEAVESLGSDLRNDPTDARRRTFLFELLCFAGAYDRAEKQLDVLARGSREAEMGAWLYRSALHAERVRQEMFGAGSLPDAPPASAVSGTLNGTPFASLTDADPRIGAWLEVFAAGQYTWLPLEHVAAVRLAAPKRLRDLLWAPARVETGPGFPGMELGEVLVPVLAPLSWKHPDDEVRLGRVTDWDDSVDGTPVPVGQRLLLVDGEPFPFLELRELEITFRPQAVETVAAATAPGGS